MQLSLNRRLFVVQKIMLKTFALIVDGFYICRAEQDVFESAEHFPMTWLELNPSSKVYHFGSMNTIHPKFILTKVELQQKSNHRFVLTTKQKAKIELCLLESLVGYVSGDNSENG